MADSKDRGGDGLKASFVFVRHGDPLPLDWMSRHPGWVKFPATLVPRPTPRPVVPSAAWDRAGTNETAGYGPTSRPVSVGAPVVQRRRVPVHRLPTGGPRDAEDPVAAYLRISRTAGEAASQYRASMSGRPGTSGQAQGDTIPANSYFLAQAEGPSAEEEFGPTGRSRSFQESLNSDLYNNAFQALREIDPGNKEIAGPFIRAPDWVPSDADVAKIEAALSAARASAAGAIPTASNSAPSPALPGAGPTRDILSNPELDSILRGTAAQTNAINNDAKSDANYPNKVGHVFDKPEHALDPVLRRNCSPTPVDNFM